jgi:hypothetical protein
MARKRKLKPEEFLLPVTLDIYHLTPEGKEVYTPMTWPPAPKDPQTLGEFMEAYCAALNPGGKCERVAKEIGYIPVPHRAELRTIAKVEEVWSWHATHK